MIIDWEKLKAGEEIKCPECKEGKIITPYNPKTSHFFKCDKCNFKINLD